MRDPDTLPEGGKLDLPSPRSPRDLDEKILRYAREHAPAPERRGRPAWVAGLATASIAGIALLLGLSDDETQTDRTPWWLLLLRMFAIAAAIVGFSGPVLNPQPENAGTGSLLVLIDGTWADASDWARRVDRIGAVPDADRGALPGG